MHGRGAIGMLAVVAGCGLDVVGTAAVGGPPGAMGNDASVADGSGDVDSADAAIDSPLDAATDAPVDAGPCGACPASAAQAMCVGSACVAARRVFVSSAMSTANLGGVTGADTKCQSLATAAGLGGTWRAWVSTNASSPGSRFTKPTVPYRMLDGTLIASSWTDLVSSSLQHPIDRDEKNVAIGAAAEVWTATNGDGTYAGSGCVGFTSANSASDTAAQGLTDKKNSGWTNQYVQFCDRTNPRIYCFEQ